MDDRCLLTALTSTAVMLRVARFACSSLLRTSHDLVPALASEVNASGGNPLHFTLWQSLRNATKKASQVRSGDVVSRDGRLLKVTKFTAEHGRARAAGFISLELVDVRSGPGSAGARTSLKLKPDESLALADLEAKDMQVLFVEGGASSEAVAHLMDPNTFDQFTAPVSVFGPAGKWLMPDGIVEVKFLDDEPVTGSLPPKVSVKVVEARPAVARDDGSTNRHVVVEGGASVLCPGHINKGDVIVVNTEEGTYVSKA